jgi:hypothetical protein
MEMINILMGCSWQSGSRGRKYAQEIVRIALKIQSCPALQDFLPPIDA